MTDPLVDAAADAFASALHDCRTERALSKKQLAAEMGFDPSYVSHVEARRHRPTEDFARRAEMVLRSGGLIWQRFREYDEARQAGAPERPGRSIPEQWIPAAGGLLVETERSRLAYLNGDYRCVVQRDLYNAGSEPVTRYLVRIAVDRYPGEAERSNRHYRDHPLTWTELNLDARAGEERMRVSPKHDRDAFKELWLLFENDEARFPLYPGQRTTIEYAYTVGEDKWGHWFQRAIRLPTHKLTVHLDFPTDLRPVVWGVETSLTAEAGPLRTPVAERADGDRTVFDWSIDDPPLNARYRLEWRFRTESRGDPHRGPTAPARPSELMRSVGIVQRGAPVLDRAARWFDLPAESAMAEEISGRLLDALQRIAELHDFSKGLGLAAPQLGIGWAAAVVRAPHTAPVVLLNPRVVAESVDHDEQFEGCLSFFDVRGQVSRPLLIEVEHQSPTGETDVTTFTQAMARLVAHEIDHLGGLLYTDRMPPESRLLPVEEYHDHGQAWHYDG